MKQVSHLSLSRGSINFLPWATQVAGLFVMRRIDELHLDNPFNIDEAVLLESRIHTARSEAVAITLTNSTDDLAERLERAIKSIAAPNRSQIA